MGANTQTSAEFIEVTSRQALALTGLSRETLRHWQTLVPHLAARKGKGAHFSQSDVLGLKIMQVATRKLGVTSGFYSRAFQQLFVDLAVSYPNANAGTFCVLANQEVRLIGHTDITAELLRNDAMLVIALSPLQATLHKSLAASDHQQGELSL